MQGLLNGRAMVIVTIAFVLLVSGVRAGDEVAGDVQVVPVLTMDGQGRLLKDGRPYRGIGMNYFSAFYRTLLKEGDTSYEEGFKVLAEHDIPFVRFMANGFWPANCKLYYEDKDEYFRRMDAVVKCAEENGIGLVPSLFWHMSALSDLVGEPVDQIGNPESKTHELMKQYTKDVVLRYRDNPTIWMWEMGNEFNLPADLPNAAEHRPKVFVKGGTPEVRTERDDITHDMLEVFFEAFAETVRKYDKQRLIVSGNSIPRQYAWHNWQEGSWDKDSREEFYEVLVKENPRVFEVISVHLYPSKKNQYFADGVVDMGGLVEAIAEISRRDERVLFVGEFGASATLEADEERAVFVDLLTAIEKSRVPLAAGWVFDLPFQEGQWNITAENDRAYMLELIGEANRRIKREMAGK